MKTISCLACMAALLLTGCAPLSQPNSSTGVDPVAEYNAPYVLAPLDEIAVMHGADKIETIKVTADDPVDYPEGEALHVLGKSPDEVVAILKKRDRNITGVQFTEYQGSRITVTGEVNIQTNFVLQDAPTRVLDAVASAGGFTPLANSSAVVLTRNNAGKIQIFRLNLHSAQNGREAYFNILLQPGDRVFVPKSFL